jgi:hypothetical protein
MSIPNSKGEQRPGSHLQGCSPVGEPGTSGMTHISSFMIDSDAVADLPEGGDPSRASNRILSYRSIQNWENYFLASAICSVAVATGADEETLRMIGHERVNSGLHFFSAITGDMFTVLYAPDKPCDSGVTACFFMPRVVKEAYSAFGYDCVYLSNEQIQKDHRAVMNAIRASVDKGIPVLAWGMGNVTMKDGSRYDPLPEACLIGGYDEDDLLYVNLYPGPERVAVDEDGYTAIANGLRTTKGLFFVGGPIDPPDQRDIYDRVVNRIPALLTLQPADGYVFGPEAFRKWADTLLEEHRFAEQTDAELSGICWSIHCSPYCNITTSAAEAFIRATAEVHDIAPAKRLLPLYHELSQLTRSIWALQGGFFPSMGKFRTRASRAEIAEILRRMGSVCDAILKASE